MRTRLALAELARTELMQTKLTLTELARTELMRTKLALAKLARTEQLPQAVITGSCTVARQLAGV